MGMSNLNFNFLDYNVTILFFQFFITISIEFGKKLHDGLFVFFSIFYNYLY